MNLTAALWNDFGSLNKVNIIEWQSTDGHLQFCMAYNTTNSLADENT